MRENILDEYLMTNKLMGEEMPLIESSVYEFMTDDDKATYDAFPDEVSIFRGAFFMEAHSQTGQSWTTEKKVAEFFAFEHTPYREADGRVVLAATISKNDIYGYTNGRTEFECIVNPDALMNMKILLTEMEGK